MLCSWMLLSPQVHPAHLHLSTPQAASSRSYRVPWRRDPWHLRAQREQQENHPSWSGRPDGCCVGWSPTHVMAGESGRSILTLVRPSTVGRLERSSARPVGPGVAHTERHCWSSRHEMPPASPSAMGEGRVCTEPHHMSLQGGRWLQCRSLARVRLACICRVGRPQPPGPSHPSVRACTACGRGKAPQDPGCAA